VVQQRTRPIRKTLAVPGWKYEIGKKEESSNMSDPTKQPPPYPTQAGAGGFVAPPPYPPQPSGYKPPSGPDQSQPGFGYSNQQAYSPPAPPLNEGLAGGYDSDAEGLPGQGTLGGFGEKAIRRNFVKKVYGILFCQLLLTFAIVLPFAFHQPLRNYVRYNTWMYWAAFVVVIVCLISMACCEGVRRKFPKNIIFLGVFTAAEGFMLGCFCARFDADAILYAIGITAGVTFGLTIFAFQTKIDFTACGGMLCALLMILMLAGIALAIAAGTGAISQKAYLIGYGSAGALVFSLYIVYDTQLMMGGKRKYALDPEEYIFAALNIYLDVINLFMYILMIVGGSTSD